MRKFVKKLINDKVIKLVVIGFVILILNMIVYLFNSFEITIIYILSFIEAMIIVNSARNE